MNQLLQEHTLCHILFELAQLIAHNLLHQMSATFLCIRFNYDQMWWVKLRKSDHGRRRSCSKIDNLFFQTRNSPTICLLIRCVKVQRNQKMTGGYESSAICSWLRIICNHQIWYFEWMPPHCRPQHATSVWLCRTNESSQNRKRLLLHIIINSKDKEIWTVFIFFVVDIFRF